MLRLVPISHVKTAVDDKIRLCSGVLLLPDILQILIRQKYTHPPPQMVTEAKTSRFLQQFYIFPCYGNMQLKTFPGPGEKVQFF